MRAVGKFQLSESFSQPPCKSILQYCRVFSPVVICFAVELSVAGVTGMVEVGVADTALEAMLMVTGIGHSHQVPIIDFVATSFTDLVVLLTLDVNVYCG